MNEHPPPYRRNEPSPAQERDARAALARLEAFERERATEPALGEPGYQHSDDDVVARFLS